MKKVFFSLVFSVSLVFAFDSYALRIFGIKIEYERGTKEWNADRTKTECVGKGTCVFKIGADVGIETAAVMPYTGQLGNVDGKLVLSIPEDYVNKFPEDFESGYLDVNSEIVVPEEYASKIKFSSEIVVRPGKYRVEQDEETGNYFVYLTR